MCWPDTTEANLTHSHVLCENITETGKSALKRLGYLPPEMPLLWPTQSRGIFAFTPTFSQANLDYLPRTPGRCLSPTRSSIKRAAPAKIELDPGYIEQYPSGVARCPLSRTISKPDTTRPSAHPMRSEQTRQRPRKEGKP